MSLGHDDAAAWRFVGAVLTVLDRSDLDADHRLMLVEVAAARLRDQVPWTCPEGGQDQR